MNMGRKLSLAKNNIRKGLNLVHETNPKFLRYRLEKLGVPKSVYKHCYEIKLFTLSDIEENYDLLEPMYDFNTARLFTLSKHVRRIGEGKVKKKSAKTKATSSTQVKAQKEVRNIIDKYFKNREIKKFETRTNSQCCLCVTFNEFKDLNKTDFISIMKKEYKNICSYELKKSRITSWEDEYYQIKNIFIPMFEEFNRKAMDFHIVFEFKMPSNKYDIFNNEYVYADAVIVSEDGFVVLEFKQKDDSSIVFDSKQAMKYVSRLRYHKLARSQSVKFCYIVYTHQNEKMLKTLDNRDWVRYGNGYAVGRDLMNDFFKNSKRFPDIRRWLNGGFKEKKAKRF